MLISCFIGGIWFLSGSEIAWLIARSSLEFFVLWTTTSEYVFTVTDLLSSWDVILIGLVYVPLSLTWTVMGGDFNTSSWVSCSNLLFNDFVMNIIHNS